MSCRHNVKTLIVPHCKLHVHGASFVAIFGTSDFFFCMSQISTEFCPPDRPDKGWRHERNTSRKRRIGGGVVTFTAGVYLGSQYARPRRSFLLPCGRARVPQGPKKTQPDGAPLRVFIPCPLLPPPATVYARPNRNDTASSVSVRLMGRAARSPFHCGTGHVGVRARQRLEVVRRLEVNVRRSAGALAVTRQQP